MTRFLLPVVLILTLPVAGCDNDTSPRRVAELPDQPAPVFRNVATPTPYAGDPSCVACHAEQTRAYRQHSMAKSFHRWTPDTRVETAMDSSLHHASTGLSYQVVEDGGALYQVEFIVGPDGRRLHELRRRMDHVMGSGHVARTYFTEENGRLFQLPLTWYTRHGWDFSPGYRLNNARFDRLMPDRCIACHSSYPDAIPFLEGKYEDTQPGIGCERCHGPGALHVAERRSGSTGTGAFDNSIVNPARLPLARRLDTCEQCHVHTAVNVLREGKDAFGYMPSQPLRDHWAFFKTSGTIDIVSHADRLRQSPCFLGSVTTSRPLECATCHNPHSPPPDSVARNRPCASCHLPDSLARRLERSTARGDHGARANCVGCHMPRMQEQGIPHGTFTEHWIRVIRPGDAAARLRRANDSGEPIEPFFERDVSGVDAPVYRAMGKIVYGTLATDARVLTTAAAELTQALGADRSRAGAHFLLGAAYEQLGRLDDAVRAHQRSVRIDATRPEALRALAYVSALTGGDPAVVDSLYREALARQPALAWVRAEHADFLHEGGRVAEAEREYRQAVREQPSLSVAWFNLGLLLSGAVRDEDAVGAYREAVRLDPQSTQALASLFRITAGPDGMTITALSLPLASLPLRDRGARAVQARVAPDTRSLAFVNLPATAILQIFRPNGSLMRTLRSQGALTVGWDLHTDRGRLIGPGLYRVRVLGRDTSGQPMPQQSFYIGLARAEDQTR